MTVDVVSSCVTTPPTLSTEKSEHIPAVLCIVRELFLFVKCLDDVSGLSPFTASARFPGVHSPSSRKCRVAAGRGGVEHCVVPDGKVPEEANVLQNQ